MTKLEPVLESLLKQVSKPGRYVGNELFSSTKDHRQVDVTFALFFPDVYELGMSYLGFQILYHLLNQQDFIAAERVFSPWPDFEEKMREHHIPLFSLESKTPVCSFDIVGVTLQYELHASNILNGLDLAGIPLLARERSEQDPLVIAGGHNATNPEPFADFFDAVVLGDGEEVVVEIARVVQRAKQQDWSRLQVLRDLATVPGVYIPAFFLPRYDEQGIFQELLTKDPAVQLPIRGRIEKLRETNFPPRPLVPLLRITHDRLGVEIMRGCTRGCRFCHAGYYYRPNRERQAEDVAEYIRKTVLTTGSDEVSLVSLSTSDYSQMQSLWQQLQDFFHQHRLSLSMPSLRPETITPELLQLLQTEKKSGLTLAPEAGSQRLRNVINKVLQEEDILQAVETAFRHGWKLVKLYFMIGLPTETDEDLISLADLVNRIGKLARRYRAKVKVSISPFNPKPQTPFQWVAQDDVDTLRKKLALVRRELSGRNIELKWRDPEVTRLEGILARGDRRLGAVIYRVWQTGARFDAWTDYFDWQRWQLAFAQAQIDPDVYTRERHANESLPWEHLTRGIPKKFFQQEWQRALQGEALADCRTAVCNYCGLMTQLECSEILGRGRLETTGAKPDLELNHEVTAPQMKPVAITPVAKPAVSYYRLQYAKTGLLRFIGHLDLVALLQRILRIAQLPLVFSEGFSPHPRLSFAPPLPLGMESTAEYLDLQLYGAEEVDLVERLNPLLPEGLQVLSCWRYLVKPPPLSQWIQLGVYQVQFPDEVDLTAAIARFEKEPRIYFSKQSKSSKTQIDLKQFVLQLNLRFEKQVLEMALRFDGSRTVTVEDVLVHGLDLTPGDCERARIIRIFMGAVADWQVQPKKKLRMEHLTSTT